ncbi:MAG: hypothetical protein ACLPQI_13120 [Steroidobacteraceae bacterium]
MSTSLSGDHCEEEAELALGARDSLAHATISPESNTNNAMFMEGRKPIIVLSGSCAIARPQTG